MKVSWRIHLVASFLFMLHFFESTFGSLENGLENREDAFNEQVPWDFVLLGSTEQKLNTVKNSRRG